MSCCSQAGVKGTAITFLMTDNQIVNEKFLVYINDLLSTGYIADLCTQEDKDTFCNSVRGEVKQAGMVDSADNCWDFFIDKVSSSPCRVLDAVSTGIQNISCIRPALSVFQMSCAVKQD